MRDSNRQSLTPQGVLLAIILILLCSASAQAENWAFQRSYYSHELAPETAAITPEPYYRSAYRLPTKYNYPGITVNSNFRINRVHLRSGNSLDSEYRYQGTIEFRP